MISDKTFKITYYAGKHKKHITRLGIKYGKTKQEKLFLHIGT